MKMKKLLSTILVFAMIFALTGCGSKGTSSSNGSAAGEKKSDIICIGRHREKTVMNSGVVAFTVNLKENAIIF